LIFDEIKISSLACEGAFIDAISFTFMNEPPCIAQPVINKGK